MCAWSRFDKSRFDDRIQKAKQKEADRRDAYRRAEIRDKFRCRVCGRQLVKTLTVQPDQLIHHHIRGRDFPGAETPENICCICGSCHDLRHVKRVLSITGNAESTLVLEQDGRVWYSPPP